MNDTGSNFSPAPSNLLFSVSRLRPNSRGAAPWNEKIDCFSSPTANTVRLTPSRAPSPGGEFGNQMRDDVPLPRAGVLRLVDQHVVDAAVELVEHPARRRRDPALPASCRSGRRSRAGRVPASRGDSSQPRRVAIAQQRLRCGRGVASARRRSSSAQSAVCFARQQRCRERDLASPSLLGHERFARRRARRSGRRRRYHRPAPLPESASASRSCAAWLFVGLAAGFENRRRPPPIRERGRFGPSTISRSTFSL